MTDDPLLLTPGPLTTSTDTRRAMLKDWGSRDTDFIEMTRRVRDRIAAIGGVDPAVASHVCVLLQGSGTFVVEATLDTLVPRDGKLLVLVNGAYGSRMEKICSYIGRACVRLEDDEDTPPDPTALDATLTADPEITHVAVVHCETTSGILNPVADIAGVANDHGVGLIIDAMSSFGALPVSVVDTGCAALVASSNKCLEGVPGVGFALIDRAALEAAAGNATSLSLDLHDQWQGFEKNGQWRFTPPTHVLAALDQALAEHEAEGGVAARGARYLENCRVLVDGMRRLGFRTYLSDNLQAPIIVTFRPPVDPAFDFDDFYHRLRRKGFAIYPGKLTRDDSFRIGCIGHLAAVDMERAVGAVADVVRETKLKVA